MTGSDPARELFDVGLQPERTALAWRRTGLSLTVAALVAVRVVPAALGPWSVLPAFVGLVAAVVVLVLAQRRHAVVHSTLTSGADDRVPLPSGALPLAVALLVLAGGVAALLMLVPALLGPA